MDISLGTIGPHWPPFLKAATIILFVLVFRMIYILVLHFVEGFLIKKYIDGIKTVIHNGNDSSRIQTIQKQAEQTPSPGFLEKIQRKQKLDIYSYFKSEITGLLIIADNVNDEYSMSSDFQLFYERLKKRYSVKLDKIKSIISFSLLTELFAIVIGLNRICQSEPFAGSDGITFRMAFLMMNEIVFATGIVLIVLLFLSWLGYFSIKKRCNLMLDEADNLVASIFKLKESKKVPDCEESN